MNEKYSSRLMDKLAGELSEKEASKFEADLKQDSELWEEYQFFSKTWEELDSIAVPNASQNLSEQFYNQLQEIQEKESQSFKSRFKQFREKHLAKGQLLPNLTLGSLLIAIGVFLGGQWGKKTINNYTHNTTIQQITPEVDEASSLYGNLNVDYVPSSVKIQQIQAIPLTAVSEEEAIRLLKEAVTNENNTNVKLAALSQLSENYSQNKTLKNFLVKQLDEEQSPLVQVELLNLMMENSKAKESVNKMETMLNQRKLNPIVQEKIKNDLPVLRASY